MKLLKRDPNKGYLDCSLWVPKAYVNVEGVKNALTFQTFDQNNISVYTLYKETDQHLVVPREFWEPKDFPFPVVDLRPRSYAEISITSRIKLDHVVRNGKLVPSGATIQQESLVAMQAARGGILQLSCGKGKTVSALELITRERVPALIVLDTTQLMKQWAESITQFLDVPDGVGLIQGPIFDWKKPIVLATYHTLAARAGELTEEVRRWFGRIVWDECFVAGTLVDGRRIETIRVGDMVRSYNHGRREVELKTVTSVFKNKAEQLVRVTLITGTVLVCTPNHPFYTPAGYVAAVALTRNCMVYALHVNANMKKASGKRYVVFVTLVDRIEILEQGKDGTPGELCPDSFVYNLEVEGNNNYFAENVLVHNCHHVNAPTFCRSADLFYGKRLGLTATPDREDGTHVICNFHIGPVLYKNLLQDLKPKICFLWTGLTLKQDNPLIVAATTDKNHELHIGKVASYFGQWKERLEFVLTQVRAAADQGRKILVLSKSVDELVNLLALWNKEQELYTDVPFPEASEVGDKLPPVSLTLTEARHFTKEYGKTCGQLKQATQKNAQALQDKKRTLETLLTQYATYKKCEAVWNKRRTAYLKTLLDKPSTAGLMIYKVDADRARAMLKSRQVTFAIMKYGREGLDEKSLDTIIVSEPISKKGSLQQLMGRALRDMEGKKEPMIIFLEDDIGPFIGMCKKLRSFLREWPVEEGGPYDYELIGHPLRKSRGAETMWSKAPIVAPRLRTPGR